jgi:hypothetical protein
MAQPRKKLAAGIALVVLCVAGYYGWRFVSIGYHRYELRAAYAQISRVESARNDYEKHRTALISLGYFVKRQFYLKRLTTRSPEFRQLLNDLQLRYPTRIGKVEAHGYIYGEPTFLVVWMHPDQAKEIGDYIWQQDAQ